MAIEANWRLCRKISRHQFLAAQTEVYFGRGRMPIGWRWSFEGGKVSRLDRRGQEDAVRFAWPGGSAATARIESPKPIDISREATGELSLLVDYRLDEPPHRR